jgi:trehalose 6-phosphate phosphatase
MMDQKTKNGLCSRPAPLAAHAGWAFFLDIDGTLLGFAATPGEVSVDRKLKDTLGRLAMAAGGAVALISGRSLAQIDQLFIPLKFAIAGQHGVERRDARGAVYRHTSRSPALAAIAPRLAPLAGRHAGLQLEDKGLTLAVHYRREPHLGSYLCRLLRELVRQDDRLLLERGKMVIEIKSRDRDKGGTIVEFMAEEPFCGRVPVFIGDDLSDEHGFRAVNMLGGHSVKVGPGRTAARHRFASVAAVRSWLERCAEGRNCAPAASHARTAA